MRDPADRRRDGLSEDAALALAYLVDAGWAAGSLDLNRLCGWSGADDRVRGERAMAELERAAMIEVKGGSWRPTVLGEIAAAHARAEEARR